MTHTEREPQTAPAMCCGVTLTVDTHLGAICGRCGNRMMPEDFNPIAAPEPLSDYWRQIARQLIDTRHAAPHDTDSAAQWVGRATAVIAEALRASGDTYGIEAVIGAYASTKARTEIGGQR